MGAPTKSPNFGILKHLDSSLVVLGAQAEMLFPIDAVASLMRLRLLGERLARELAAHAGLRIPEDERQVDLINDLRSRRLLHPDVAGIAHQLRMVGNRAVHEGKGTQGEALHQLKMARRLAIAVLRTLGKLPSGYKAGPFVPPAAPADATAEMREELASLREEAQSAAEARDEAAEVAAFEKELREDYERQLARLRAKLEETEQAFEELAADRDEEIAEVQAAVASEPPPAQQKNFSFLVAHAEEAGTALDLTEAETRGMIDQQLRDAGWNVDSQTLRHAKGARPAKGRNMAIAEWPTANGPADYALFVGLKLVGIVEAKRVARSVVGALEQAKRYSRGVVVEEGMETFGGPWGDFLVPFVFATNGRPFLRQILEESGIWFQDVRRPTNLPRALVDWRSPQGLSKLLAQDIDEAHAKLEGDPVEKLGLRYYQEAAIREVEKAIEAGERTALLAMATGVGKTRTCIGLVYRLLNAGRFNRVLFVVDRSALGEQAEGAFNDVKVDQSKTFAEIFDIKGLDSEGVESATRLHIATIQSLVRQVLYSDDAPPVDTCSSLPWRAGRPRPQRRACFATPGTHPRRTSQECDRGEQRAPPQEAKGIGARVGTHGQRGGTERRYVGISTVVSASSPTCTAL